MIAIDMSDPAAVGRAFTRTLAHHSQRRAEGSQGLVGKLVYYRPSTYATMTAAVVVDVEEGYGALEGITFATLLPLEGMRHGDRRTDRLDVDVESTAALEVLDRTQAHAVAKRWEGEHGKRLPDAARIQAGLKEEPLTREGLRRMLSDFAAEVETDVTKELPDWSTGTERQFERLADRLGLA